MTFGLGGFVLKEFPVTFWPAPNVNSVGAISRGGRVKIEGVPAQLKAGKAGSGGRSLGLGKPKSEDGPAGDEKAAEGRRKEFPTDPKRVFSYSCRCW